MRTLYPLALAFAVALGFAAPGPTANAAGVASSAVTQAPSSASAVDQVHYRGRGYYGYGPSIYFGFGAPRYYGYYGAPRYYGYYGASSYYGYGSPRYYGYSRAPTYYYRTRDYRPYYYRHNHYYGRRHYRY